MMTRFKTKLLSLNPTRTKPLKVFSPANCDELRIPFKRDKFAKAVGHVLQLPSTISEDDGTTNELQLESGLDTADLLVQNDLNLTFMAAKNFQEYAAASSTTIATEKRFVCSAGVDLIRWGLEGMFGSIEQIPAESVSHTRFLIMEAVTVDVAPSGQVVVGWESSLMNDNIADSVLAVMLQMETGIVGVKRMSVFLFDKLQTDELLTGSGAASPHTHEHNPHSSVTSDGASDAQVLGRLLLLLENQFSSVTPLPNLNSSPTNGYPESASRDVIPSSMFTVDDPVLEISVPPHVAHVHLRDLRVESASNALRTRVAAVVEKACETVVGIAG
jgi:cleavage and polyadenylation specificity factor subunit 3